MNLPVQVTQEELSEILLTVAPVRPVFIWGAPGIGKSALVEQFAMDVGMECVSLLGSQLAPEDIIGIPRINGNVSEFLPPKMIARNEPYVLFLDELNACSQEVQKAFYSLIYERRIGEYHLPKGSVVIGAGNRAQDNAIVKTMSSALVNRMFHVQLKVDVNQWLSWAYTAGIHEWVTDYITARPEHLFSVPPKTEEPFSTPRSWHTLSDLIKEFQTTGLSAGSQMLPGLRGPILHVPGRLQPAAPVPGSHNGWLPSGGLRNSTVRSLRMSPCQSATWSIPPDRSAGSGRYPHTRQSVLRPAVFLYRW